MHIKVNEVFMFRLFKLSIACVALFITLVIPFRVKASPLNTRESLTFVAKDRCSECCPDKEGKRGARGKRGHRGAPGAPGSGATQGAAGNTGPTGAGGATGPSETLSPAYLSTRANTQLVVVPDNSPVVFDPLPPMTYGTSNITIDGAGQTITVLEDGDYDISYFVSPQLPATLNSSAFALYVNGLQVGQSLITADLQLDNPPGFNGFNGEIILSLVAGSQIQLINLSGAPITLEGGIVNYLIINRVS